MFPVLILCLMLVSRVEGTWGTKNRDPSDGVMGFSYINMTCNEAGDVCQNCLVTRLFGQVFLAVQEYTKEPYKFEAKVSEGRQSRDWFFSQDEPEEKYRWCDSFDSEASWEYDKPWGYTYCIENIFSGIAVPAGCAKPLAVLTYDIHYSDEELHGEQVLFCLT
ncbi:uncharacterized protein LOC119737193 [Patiria miniata]|uniref:Uncharacterized protein n=1 Tax=Patiria miniata TaxID=46514 RepID=A0A914AU61_PATMI|nr:uncharacterized protein LOC119737193 [Patiria miniata]